MMCRSRIGTYSIYLRQLADRAPGEVWSAMTEVFHLA